MLTDVSPLEPLDTLRHLDIASNQVEDLAPLALGTAFTRPSFLSRNLISTDNPLSSGSVPTYIPMLTDRGVNVMYSN